MGDGTIPPLVSICIPTCNRPALLRVALESCIAQTYENVEIVIGDDSKDDRSEAVVVETQSRYPGKIRYIRNIPTLGQAGNVNMLFMRAAGDRLVLLHDDDLLLPGALKDLSDCWAHSPSLAAAFGKQYVIDMDGEILLEKSERINILFGRTADAAGEVIPGLAGIKQMFPNDGYMVLTGRARTIGYRAFSRVGAACDFDFAVRYCADNVKVWFHDGYTASYRLTDDAISRTSITAPFVYEILKEYNARKDENLAPEVVKAMRKAIEQQAGRAVSGYARLGRGSKALRILISSDYALRERFRVKFLLHSALTFSALIAGRSGANFILSTLEWCTSFAKPPRISG